MRHEIFMLALLCAAGCKGSKSTQQGTDQDQQSDNDQADNDSGDSDPTDIDPSDSGPTDNDPPPPTTGGRFTSLAASSTRVLVATHDEVLGNLVVIDATDTANRRFTVVDGPSAGTWTAIALAEGRGRCAYQTTAPWSVKLASENADGSWSTSVIDDVGSSGRDTALAIDSSGVAAIAYVVGTELRVAHGASKVVVANGAGIKRVSIVVLPDGRLAVSYIAANTLNLVVDLTPVVLATGAEWSSSVVDASGTIHVAYQDVVAGHLKYTTWNGTQGPVEIVDDGQRAGDRPHRVGAATAIYLDGAAPGIAYQDGSSADVYLATKDGTWSTSAVVSDSKLDGFWLSAARTGSATYFAWRQVDPSASSPGSLVIISR